MRLRHREKLNSKVLFDEDGWTRLLAEVPKMKLVTPSALCERLKVNASLARAACRYLQEVLISISLLTHIMGVQEGKIVPVEIHNKQWIYTRNTV